MPVALSQDVLEDTRKNIKLCEMLHKRAAIIAAEEGVKIGVVFEEMALLALSLEAELRTRISARTTPGQLQAVGG